MAGNFVRSSKYPRSEKCAYGKHLNAIIWLGRKFFFTKDPLWKNTFTQTNHLCAMLVLPPRAGSNNSIDADLRERLDQSLLGCIRSTGAIWEKWFPKYLILWLKRQPKTLAWSEASGPNWNWSHKCATLSKFGLCLRLWLGVASWPRTTTWIKTQMK